MGITNGHKFLKVAKALQNSHLDTIRGKVVAVDIFIDIYKMLFSSCPDDQ
jgi:hypothetical protein